jgi:ERCC4-type nuclease
VSALIDASDDGIVVVHGARWRAPAHVMVISAQVHRHSVDHSERHSALLEAARRSGAFDIRMVHLDTGDYLIDDEVLVERKTLGDFVASLVDGRLFPQTARLVATARC